MNGCDREIVARLVPHMRRLPGRLQVLLSQIIRVRRAYEGETPGGNDVPLAEYKENLEAELRFLEHEAREVATAAKIIRGLLNGPDMAEIARIHLILDEAVSGGSEDGD